MSFEVGLKKIRLILLEDSLILLLALGCPRSRWMLSKPDLFQRVLPFHPRLGMKTIHHSWASTHPLHSILSRLCFSSSRRAGPSVMVLLLRYCTFFNYQTLPDSCPKIRMCFAPRIWRSATSIYKWCCHTISSFSKSFVSKFGDIASNLGFFSL